MTDRLVDFPREPKTVHGGERRTYGFRPPCRHEPIPVSVAAEHQGLATWSPIGCPDRGCDLVFTVRERPSRTYVDYWIIHPSGDADANVPASE